MFLLPAWVAIAALPYPARADDAWLVADPAVVEAGQGIWLGFVGGSVFPLSETLVAPEDVDSMEDVSGSEARSLFDADSPPDATGRRESLEELGIHVFAGRLLPQVIEMSGTQFDDYLNEERAAVAILERLHDDPDAQVVEEYTRFAKTIVEVGPTPDDDAGYSVAIGHRLEIVPLANPCRVPIGQAIEFEVLLDGYPWPGVPLSACREGFESQMPVAETVTDESGRAAIAIDGEGQWLVRAHFIRRTAGLRRAEWESFWATLTFRVAPDDTETLNSEPAADVNAASAAESPADATENMTKTVNPPIRFPLDELYGFFSPYLRITKDDAA